MIVELEGPAEEVEAEIPLLDKVIQESSACQVRVARNAAERMTIWKGRKCAFSAVGRLSPDYIVQDGVVPRTRSAHVEASDRLIKSSERSLFLNRSNNRPFLKHGGIP